jgi:hypothetical protein
MKTHGGNCRRSEGLLPQMQRVLPQMKIQMDTDEIHSFGRFYLCPSIFICGNNSWNGRQMSIHGIGEVEFFGTAAKNCAAPHRPLNEMHFTAE